MQKAEASVREIKCWPYCPSPVQPLQARYRGPYLVQEEVNDRDYIVATPERRRRNRLCHINMLKPHLDRKSVLLSPVREDGKAVQCWTY